MDFGGHAVDAQGIEDGFGAAEDEGGGQADGGVGAVLFVEVEDVMTRIDQRRTI